MNFSFFCVFQSFSSCAYVNIHYKTLAEQNEKEIKYKSDDNYIYFL